MAGAEYALANILGSVDFNRLADAKRRMRPIANEIAETIQNPPRGRGSLSESLAAMNRTSGCFITLMGNYDGFESKFSTVVTLVGLAARMENAADEALVVNILGVEVWGFLEHAKLHRKQIELNASKCSDDGATVAKSQEIKRIYDEVVSAVEPIALRIGATESGARSLNSPPRR